LLSDFGLKDPYVAEMKAVILSINPDAKLVDISHEVEKFDIRTGAYILACAAPYFPKGTVHVAVVDPSVGTRRQPIIIQTCNACYVGPDNGVLALAARNDGGLKSIHKITNRKLMLPNVSSTFHGRDVFAPVAAHLANGTSLTEFGPKISKIITPRFASVTKKQEVLIGEVIYIDDFGNIVTNFQEKDIQTINTGRTISIRTRNIQLALKLCKTYADVPPHEPLALIGSHNFLEISLNHGNAAEAFGTRKGDRVTIRLS
jgi:hypothetical protein